MGPLIWEYSKLCIYNSILLYTTNSLTEYDQLSRAGNKSIIYFLLRNRVRKYYWDRQYSSKMVGYIVIMQSMKGAAHHRTCIMCGGGA